MRPAGNPAGGASVISPEEDTEVSKTDKKKFETFVTPRGTASWPHLNAPDTEYDDRGVFHTKLVFDPEKPDHAKFLAELEERLEAHVEEVKSELPPAKQKKLTINPIVRDEEDRESGEPTGKKVVSFKMYASSTKDGVTKKREPRFFDAKGAKLPISKLPKLSGGSELKIEYSISGYNTPKGTGITLYLTNVQVIKAVEYSGGGSKFGDEGEGFSVKETEGGAFSDESEELDETQAEATDGDF